MPARRDLSPARVGSVVGVALFTILGGILLLLATRQGPSFSPDGSAYVASAEHLADGRGFTTPFAYYTGRLTPREIFDFHDEVPVTFFPPGYPAAIAFVSKFGMSIDTATRVLNVLAFCAVLALVGVCAASLTTWDAPGAVVGPIAVVLCAAPGWAFGLLTIATFVLAETLFIAEVLAGSLVLARLLSRWSQWMFAIVILFCVITVTTRFVGVAFALAAAAAIMWGAPLSRWARAAAAAAILAAGVLPILVQSRWAQARGVGARTIRVHFPDGVYESFKDTFIAWLLPSHGGLPTETWNEATQTGVLVGLAVAIVAAGLIARSARVPPELSGNPRRQLLRVLICFAVAFPLVVLSARTLLGATIPLDVRMFAPLLPVLALLLGALAYRAARLPFGPFGAGVTVLGICALVAVPAVGSIRDYVGMAEAAAPPDKFAAEIKRLPADATLASTNPESVWLLAHRSALLIPPAYLSDTGEHNRRLKCQLAELADLLRGKNAYVTMFKAPFSRGPATLSQVQEAIPMNEIASSEERSLYRVDTAALEARPPAPATC